jgi:high-affinity Fe2+/Pb2+ permease
MFAALRSSWGFLQALFAEAQTVLADYGVGGGLLGLLIIVVIIILLLRLI